VNRVEVSDVLRPPRVEPFADEGVDLFVPATYDVVWSVVVAVVVLLTLTAVVAIVVLVRRRPARPERVGTGTVESRLAEVDRLHATGALDDDERQAARTRILGTL